VTYLFVYRGGVVPHDQIDQNINELWKWLDELRGNGYEKVRFAGHGRKTVSRDSVDEYQGDIFGISIVEADSLEDAVSLTARWPEFQYGGRIDLFESLAVDFPFSGSTPYIIKLFADLRKQILNTVLELPISKFNRIPQGFHNNLHWQLGHVLTIADELVFTLSGAASRLPPNYKTYFASGTNPRQWADHPPQPDVLLRNLEEQMENICKEYGGKLTQPVDDRANFLEARTVGELFQVLIAHESLHLGVINAMTRLV